ncbi:MAG: hypothetical protein HQL36_12610, partial [Alphaproteobacteria bacterium]|nr:hypothetical protein [Alphaproteobacteria bacterium]
MSLSRSLRKPGAPGIALALAVVLAVVLGVVPPYFGGDGRALLGEWFADPDAYMRMVRVRDWLSGGDWYANLSVRSNWPYGDTLHWTRPLDIGIAALAAPLWPFLGGHAALYVAGVVASPVFYVLTIWVLLWGTRSLLDPRGRVVLVVLFAFQPITHYYFVAARPDHHSLILLVFAAVVALLARHVHDPNATPRAPALAGAVAAFGLWVSIETLTIELLALALLGLLWIARGEERWLRALALFSKAGALCLLPALMIERPPAEWLGSEDYDRLSTVHAVLLALIAMGVEGLWRNRARIKESSTARLAWSGAAAGLATVLLAGLYPGFFKGPFGAAMDPRLDGLWLTRVKEFHSLATLDADTAITAVMVLGPMIWVGIWIRSVRGRAAPGDGARALALLFALAVALYAPLTVWQERWGAYMGVILVIPWAMLAERLMDWRGGPIVGPAPGTPALRAPLVALVLAGHVVTAVLIDRTADAPESPVPPVCQWARLAPHLNSPGFA